MQTKCLTYKMLRMHTGVFPFINNIGLQSDLQIVHLLKDQQYYAVVHKDNKNWFRPFIRRIEQLS